MWGWGVTIMALVQGLVVHEKDRWRGYLDVDVLTLQVFLLRGCLFVRGGFAHRSAHLGSRQAVLSRGDAVRQRLPRHLLSAEYNQQASNMVLPRPLLTHTHARRNERAASVIPAALENTTQTQAPGKEILGHFLKSRN